MRAVVGDKLHVHGRVVGTSDQTSEIIETQGRDGAPATPPPDEDDTSDHDDGLSRSADCHRFNDTANYLG